MVIRPSLWSVHRADFHTVQTSFVRGLTSPEFLLLYHSYFHFIHFPGGEEYSVLLMQLVLLLSLAHSSLVGLKKQ